MNAAFISNIFLLEINCYFFGVMGNILGIVFVVYHIAYCIIGM